MQQLHENSPQADAVLRIIAAAPARRPVLIAGPTASGKSALALRIAETCGGVIVNADALQVFDGWRILTARPDDADLARAPHLLYGHVPMTAHIPWAIGCARWRRCSQAGRGRSSWAAPGSISPP